MPLRRNFEVRDRKAGSAHLHELANRSVTESAIPIRKPVVSAVSLHEVAQIPSAEQFSSRAELQMVTGELQRAIEEIQAEVEWHRQALKNAEERARTLSEHLKPLSAWLALTQEATGEDLPDAAPEANAEDNPGKSLLRIYCLGTFRVCWNGEWVKEWPSLKGQAILRYLAAHRHSPVSRDVLMDTFWPEAEPEAARRNLHQAIYSIRQVLRSPVQPAGPDAPNGTMEEADSLQPVLFENGHYGLNPQLRIWIDVEEFEERVKAARKLQSAGAPMDAALEFSFALDLYRGDFLEEVGVEDWTTPRRISLRNGFSATTAWLSRYFYEQEDYGSAVGVCGRMLELDPCAEPAHYLLMQCFAQQGERSAAIRQYHACMQAMREELGVSPSAETQTLFKRLIQESDGE